MPTDELADKLFDKKIEIATVAEKAMAEVTMSLVDKEIQALKELFADGFQFSDIFKAVTHLMEAAEIMEGTTGEEKKEFVIQTFKKFYEQQDDIDLSRWIPQWIEKKLITAAIDNLLPYAIDWIIDASKGKLKLNKN